MALLDFFGTIMNASYAATDPITSDDVSAQIFGGAQGSTASGFSIHAFSTRAGTITVKYVDRAANARDISGAVGLAVPASTLTTINLNQHYPKIRCVFTPDAATAGTIRVEAYSKG